MKTFVMIEDKPKSEAGLNQLMGSQSFLLNLWTIVI